MEIEEWLSSVQGEMETLVLDLQHLLQVIGRYFTQPSLSGFRVPPTMTEALVVLAQSCYSLRTDSLKCAYLTGTQIGPDGRPA
jgi:hypothetical protein